MEVIMEVQEVMMDMDGEEMMTSITTTSMILIPERIEENGGITGDQTQMESIGEDSRGIFQAEKELIHSTRRRQPLKRAVTLLYLGVTH